MSDKNHTRRKLLKATGLGIMTGGITSPVHAAGQESGQRTSQNSSTPDISVRNLKPTPVSTVLIFEPISGNGKRQTLTISLPEAGVPSARSTNSLDLKAGKYNVKIAFGNDSAETITQWNIPPGGIPSYESLMLRILPSGAVKVFRSEA